MFKKLKAKLNNYIDERIKSAQSQPMPKPELLEEDSASSEKLTPEQINAFLDMSFQRKPEDVFKIETADGKRVALDSACGHSMPKMYGLEGIGSNIIYTFFAKHGFIGWQLCALLSQHWLIHRACTIPNQDAIRPGWENIYEKDSEDAKEELLADLHQKSLQTYHLDQKAVQFGNNRKIFGIGIAFPVVEGMDYSVPFNPDAVKPGTYKGMAIIDPYWCLPSWTPESMTEPGNLHFYEPEYYSFPFDAGIKKVHRSHLIISTHGEVPDILKPSYYFGGIPLPQMLYERVYAAEKVANEAPLMALKKRLVTITCQNLEQMFLNPEEWKKRMDFMTLTWNNHGILATGPGNQVSQIDTALADFDQLIMTQYQIVGGICDIPMFKLMGSQFKGLNPTGEGELKNYIQTLQSLQENVFRPVLERHNLLSLRSDFESKERVSVKFNPVDMPTEKELAEVENLKAQTDTAYVNTGILTPEEVRAKLSGDESNSYNSLSEELPADLGLEEEAFHENELPKEEVVVGDEWEESKHPRKDNGQFGTGSSTGKKAETSTASESKYKIDSNSILKNKEEINAKAIKATLNTRPIAKIQGDEFKGESMEEKREKAKSFFEQELKGKEFENKDLGKTIKVSSGKKSFSESGYEDKINSVKYLPILLTDSKYLGRTEDAQKRANVKGFHYFACKVETEKGPKLILLSAKEDNSGNLYYNHHIKDETVDSVKAGIQSGTGTTASEDSIAEINPKIKWHFGD